MNWLHYNYLIMITLSMFELNWWDSFWEFNVLKSVNILYFGLNNKKVGKFSLKKIFYLFNLFTFQIWENIKAKFPQVIVKNKCHFPELKCSLWKNLSVLSSFMRKYIFREILSQQQTHFLNDINLFSNWYSIPFC